MRNLKISLCHHVTTVVFIDDSQDYLSSLRGRFNELVPLRCFDKPTQALTYLNETYQEETFIKRCTIKPTDDTANHFEYDVNLEAIQQELYRPQRFGEIAVVIVDYAMPKMNGIEFCKQIKNPNIFVILLTGEADNNIAINAFNEGIIDMFLEKKPNIMDVLYEHIQKLERQYFIALSNILMNQANSDNLTCLEDEAVAKQFYQLYQEHNIVEHYIISEKGDFLLINSQGKPHWLTIKSDAEIQSLYEFAALSGSTPAVLTALQYREKIPLFYAATDSTPAPEEWDSYLSLAYPIANANNYYYAYKADTEQDDGHLATFLPYRDYLASV